jgi:ribonuclease J
MLKKHKELAMDVGIPEENIIIANNGAKVEITANEAKINGKVQAGVTLIDGIGIGDVGNIVLRDRQHLAQDGVVIVVTTISAQTGKLLAGPDLITRGFVYARESENMIKEATEKIKEELKKYEEENVTEWSILKNAIKETTSKFLYEQTKRSPIILPIIMEV